MTKVKTTKLNKGIKKGTQIPVQQKYSDDPGAIGQWMQRQMSNNGYNINTGAGVDLPDFDLEMKTRNINSTSAHTIGSMTVNDIISTSYKDTLICKKSQRQYRVKYDDNTSTVVDEKVYDFSDPYIQDRIEESYNIARNKIINGDRGDYIKGGDYGYFEKQTDNSYQYRVSNKAMKNIETMSSNSVTVKKFFE